MPVGADNKSPKKNLLSLVKEPEIGHSQKTENSKNKNDPPPGEKTMEKTPISKGWVGNLDFHPCLHAYNKALLPCPQPSAVREDRVGSQDFHIHPVIISPFPFQVSVEATWGPHPAVTRHSYLSLLGWYKRRPRGELGLSLPHGSNDAAPPTFPCQSSVRRRLINQKT